MRNPPDARAASDPGSERRQRAVLKTGWAALVLIAMVIMTKGLWATVHFEPTSDAIADEGKGHVLIAVA